jgi:hypothetical protein
MLTEMADDQVYENKEAICYASELGTLPLKK